VGYNVIRPDELDWETRPHEEDEAPHHFAGLTDIAGFEHTRANLWRYEPGSKGRRHKDMLQEETFVVLQGTLAMYLGEPPVREEIPTGGVVHVTSGTPLQITNEGAQEILLYAYGAPPERGHAEFLDSAV
jgi:mannose-6-phosphate isomerase-like protein (cupin superfamily)